MGASPRLAMSKNWRRKMRPAEGDCDPVRRQLLVRRIAIALDDATIAREQLLQMFAATARRVGVDDSRRVGSAPGPVVARHRPEVARLGLAASGIEHRHRRLIDGELGGGQEIGLEPFIKRHQFRCRIAHPERQRRAIQIDALGASILAWR